MPLNLADRNAVRVNIVPRCTQLIAEYALYILDNPNATEGKLAWARVAIRDTASYGEQVSHYVMRNQDYIDNGSGIADNTLESVVQTAINNHFVTEPGTGTE